MKHKKPIKVLFVSRAYGKNAGGMERLSFEMIRSVSNLDIVAADVIANETQPGISLLSARIRSILFLFLITPKAIFQARKYDLIHLGDPVLSKVGWLIQKIWNTPVVVTVHGLDVRYSNPLYKLYLRLFFRNFDGYIAISEHAKRALLPWNVRGDVSVIPPGMSDDIYSATYSRADLSRLIGVDTTKHTVLLTVGRLVPRKGHAWFVRNVLPMLPKSFMYVIAGSGSEAEVITDAALDAGVQDRVVQLGRVSDKDLKVLYNTVDMFIQPNVPTEGDAEGFGIVMLEAALCNRSVVASKIDGIPTAIHHKKNGYLVPPQDVDAWVSTIKAAIKAKPLAAREYTLATFSWEKIAAEYITAFRQLLKTEGKA